MPPPASAPATTSAVSCSSKKSGEDDRNRRGRGLCREWCRELRPFACFGILQVGVRGGHARPGHRNHPTVDFDPVPVRVEEVEGVAPATADETLLASLGGVHVGTTDDIHAARAHMVER